MKKIVLLYILGIAISFGFFTQESPLQKSIRKGAEVYTDFCVTCHLPNGKGIPGAFPPLAQSDYLLKNRTNSIKAVKYGQSGSIIVNGKTYTSVMPSLGLTDEEVADVMNYILHSWNNPPAKIVTPKEVADVKKN